MPRLKCSFRQFIEAIEANGFTLLRHDGGSHRRFRGMVDGKVRFVDVAYHGISEMILPRTLDSMIRQSGLPKNLFRR